MSINIRLRNLVSKVVTQNTPMRQEEREWFEDWQRFIGTLASKYSEAELLQIYHELKVLAELLLDIYTWKKERFESSEGSGKIGEN